MQVLGDTVRFSECDMAFVRKFGIAAATEMVLDYTLVQPLPFLYDTYQTAACLKIGRRKLYNYWNHADDAYRAVTIRKKNGGVRRLVRASRTASPYSAADSAKTADFAVCNGLCTRQFVARKCRPARRQTLSFKAGYHGFFRQHPLWAGLQCRIPHALFPEIRRRASDHPLLSGRSASPRCADFARAFQFGYAQF